MVGHKCRLTWHGLDALGMIEQAFVLVGAIRAYDLIFLGDQLGPRDRHLDRGQARIARVGRIVDQAGRLNQVLGRQTPSVGTGAPHRAMFGHGDRLAQFGGMQGGGKGS
jgi:hypothetical protein